MDETGLPTPVDVITPPVKVNKGADEAFDKAAGTEPIKKFSLQEASDRLRAKLAAEQANKEAAIKEAEEKLRAASEIEAEQELKPESKYTRLKRSDGQNLIGANEVEIPPEKPKSFYETVDDRTDNNFFWEQLRSEPQNETEQKIANAAESTFAHEYVQYVVTKYMNDGLGTEYPFKAFIKSIPENRWILPGEIDQSGMNPAEKKKAVEEFGKEMALGHLEGFLKNSDTGHNLLNVVEKMGQAGGLTMVEAAKVAVEVAVAHQIAVNAPSLSDPQRDQLESKPEFKAAIQAIHLAIQLNDRTEETHLLKDTATNLAVQMESVLRTNPDIKTIKLSGINN